MWPTPSLPRGVAIAYGFLHFFRLNPSVSFPLESSPHASILSRPLRNSFPPSYPAKFHQFSGPRHTRSLAACDPSLSWRVPLYRRNPLRPCAPFFRFLLVFGVLPCLSVPCGLCVCASLPSGPSPPLPGSGLYRFLPVTSLRSSSFATSLWSLRPSVTSSCSFVSPSCPHSPHVALFPGPPSGGPSSLFRRN